MLPSIRLTNYVSQSAGVRRVRAPAALVIGPVPGATRPDGEETLTEMGKRKRDLTREDRIQNEVIVDAYGPEEQALGWYYYLEDKIRFPFQAKCIVTIGGFAASQKRTYRSPVHSSRRCMLRRYARADHMARPERGSSPIPTDSPRSQRINHRGHSRLALLGRARLPLLKASYVLFHRQNRGGMVKQAKSQPTWVDVKAKLASFDRAGLLRLVRDLYDAHKDNRTFLHVRLGLGDDILKPYKQTIDRWLWPDVLRNQDTSVAKAKQSIFHYRKAVGGPAGLAELMVFFCERAAGFCSDLGNEDEDYFDALVRMFEQALTVANELPADSRDALVARLDRVREISHQFGYGVGDDMDFLLVKYVKRRGRMSMRRQ